MIAIDLSGATNAGWYSISKPLLIRAGQFRLTVSLMLKLQIHFLQEAHGFFKKKENGTNQIHFSRTNVQYHDYLLPVISHTVLLKMIHEVAL